MCSQLSNLVYSNSHPLFNDVNVIVVDHEVPAQVLQLPPLLGDDGGLVGVDEDAGGALSSSETPPIFILFLKRIDSLSTRRIEHIEIFVIHCWQLARPSEQNL